MKKLFFFTFLLLSTFCRGQINDPIPNFDLEKSFQNTENPGSKWDFSKKPFKQIITRGDGNPTVDKFDSIGRHIERNVYWTDFTVSAITKYKGNRMVEFTRKKTYKDSQNGTAKLPDEITSTKLTLDAKGNILGGVSYKLEKDSTFKVTGNQYYDKKNRLVATKDVTGAYINNYYYSGENLVRNEQISQVNPKTKVVIERIYKYNKDNQIVFSESTKSVFENNELKEKKSYKWVELTYKNKLLVKKILKDDDETIERSYAYDKDNNLTTFIEIKKNNSDGMVTAQTKRTKKYENNILKYAEVQEGLSTQQGKFSFTYYFHSENDSLAKTETTYEKGNLQTEYIYNEYNHLIKNITTYLGKSKQSEVVYEIEYY